MGNKLAVIIVSLLLTILISGCSVASEKEIVKFAKEKYGEATLISTDEKDGESVKCFFKDEEYGFEYYVSSYMNEILIDGASFGSTENKGSDFDIQYYNYMNETVKDELDILKNKYNIDIKISDGTYIYYFAKVYYNTQDASNVAIVTKEVSDLYTALDTRHYWKGLIVEAYDFNGEYLGAYHYEQGKWMTPEEENDLVYVEHIKNLSSEAIFVRKEPHSFAETDVDINDVVQVLGNPEVKANSTVNFYYFTVRGKEYYLCDFMITNDIGGFEWYTNYKE